MNIFVDLTKLGERYYTMDIISYPANMPKIIKDYLYITRGIILETNRYLMQRTSYVDVYIIRDDTVEFNINETMLIDDKPTIIILNPELGNECISDINKRRIKNVTDMYKYIFRFIYGCMNPSVSSTLYQLFKYSPYVIPAILEYSNMPFNIDDFVHEDIGLTKKMMNEILSVSDDTKGLFILGALYSIIKN
ncbi:MAG: hypothetical protein ACRCXT_06190 [Paraclostridium sp.]